MDVPANPNLTCDGNCVAVPCPFCFQSCLLLIDNHERSFPHRSVPFFISIVLIVGRINFGSIL